MSPIAVNAIKVFMSIFLMGISIMIVSIIVDSLGSWMTKAEVVTRIAMAIALTALIIGLMILFITAPVSMWG
jgi:hypothetical protein